MHSPVQRVQDIIERILSLKNKKNILSLKQITRI